MSHREEAGPKMQITLGCRTENWVHQDKIRYALLSVQKGDRSSSLTGPTNTLVKFQSRYNALKKHIKTHLTNACKGGAVKNRCYFRVFRMVIAGGMKDKKQWRKNDPTQIQGDEGSTFAVAPVISCRSWCDNSPPARSPGTGAPWSWRSPCAVASCRPPPRRKTAAPPGAAGKRRPSCGRVRPAASCCCCCGWTSRRWSGSDTRTCGFPQKPRVCWRIFCLFRGRRGRSRHGPPPPPPRSSGAPPTAPACTAAASCAWTSRGDDELVGGRCSASPLGPSHRPAAPRGPFWRQRSVCMRLERLEEFMWRSH